MAVSNFLPAGNGADLSAVIAVAAGQVLALAGAGDGYWRVTIQREMSNGVWASMGDISWDRPLLNVYGEANWRLLRQAGASCLVDGALA